MSVLIEAHSVVVKCDSIHQNYRGGWDQFAADVPNRTLCCDGEVARVGFMAPTDADGYIRYLLSCGLRYFENGNAVDIAGVFQLGGLKQPCDWLEVLRLSSDVEKGTVVCGRLRGGCGTSLATPASWKFQGSLSQTFGVFSSPGASAGLSFVRHENGVDVYYDTLAEKEAFVGRTGE